MPPVARAVFAVAERPPKTRSFVARSTEAQAGRTPAPMRANGRPDARREDAAASRSPNNGAHPQHAAPAARTAQAAWTPPRSSRAHQAHNPRPQPAPARAARTTARVQGTQRSQHNRRIRARAPLGARFARPQPPDAAASRSPNHGARPKHAAAAEQGPRRQDAAGGRSRTTERTTTKARNSNPGRWHHWGLASLVPSHPLRATRCRAPPAINPSASRSTG